MAKGSPKKNNKDSKSKDNNKKGSKNKSPDKKAKHSPTPPEAECKPINAVNLHPNKCVKTEKINWLTGPGFTFIINHCYTKNEALLFRDFFNLPLWDRLTLDKTKDAYCRMCVHGACKDLPGQYKIQPSNTNIDMMKSFWDKDLPQWDYLDINPNYMKGFNRNCCINRNLTNIKDVDIASIPDGPRYINTHNIKLRLPTKLKPIPPINLGVGYTYIRDLGLKPKYQEILQKEIQKSYLNLKPTSSIDETIIKRGNNQKKLGLVLTVLPGPNCFIVYMVKNLPASHAKLEFGDQLINVDGLLLTNRLALSRLTESESIKIDVIYTKCPFKLYYNVTIPKNEDSLGFTLVDGEIIQISYESSAKIVKLPLNYQIVEINKECIVGLTNTELKRELRNKASEHIDRTINVTVIPRYIYEALVGQLDMKYVRNRALKENLVF